MPEVEREAAGGVSQWRFELRSYPHDLDASGRTDNHRLPSLEQNGKALLLQGRMKSADHQYAVVAPLPRQITGFDNQITGAFGRAEKGRLLLFEDVKIAQDGYSFRGLIGGIFS
ncbi:MAG TPA: hypothetical protein VF888_06755 [Nitrospirota bacterium]